MRCPCILVIALASTAICCAEPLPHPESGPGIGTCFPGDTIAGTEPTPIVLGTGGYGWLWLLEWDPEPALRPLELDRPVKLLGITDAEGRGVLGLSEVDEITTDLVHVLIEPTPAVSTLTVEESHQRWVFATHARDGESFFVIRDDLYGSPTRPGFIERRRLDDGSVIVSREVDTYYGITLSADATLLYYTRPPEEPGLQPVIEVLDPGTLETIDSVENEWAGRPLDSTSGRFLYFLQGWTGLSVLDVGTLETVSWSDTFINPKATAFTPDGGHLLITHQASDASCLSVYDTGRDQRCNWVYTGLTPIALALTAGGRYAVTGDLGGSLTILDTATMEVIATLPLDTPPDKLVVLEPPPGAAPPPPQGPILDLVRDPPGIEIEMRSGDSPIDPDSVMAFIDERDLTPLVRVEGNLLALHLGKCDRYAGTNHVTISVLDVDGRAGKIMVTFEEPEETDFFMREIIVGLEEGRGPLDGAMVRCARRIGAILVDEMPRDDIFQLYRVPLCMDPLDAALHFGDCPGVEYSLPNFPLPPP